jgi:hypothetical protein
MTYLELYENYEVPPNLRDHLLTVTKVAVWVLNNWVGDLPVDKDEVIGATMLHDIANIAKFTLDDPTKIQDQRIFDDLDRWRSSQDRFIAKYGSDDHEATDKILDEIGVSDRIRSAIQDKSFINIIRNAVGDDWLTKIVSYADFRVNPDGLATLDERVEYIRTRYPDKYGSRPDFPDMVVAMRSLETQIAKNISAPTSDLTVAILDPDTVNYLSMEVFTA